MKKNVIDKQNSIASMIAQSPAPTKHCILMFSI